MTITNNAKRGSIPADKQNFAPEALPHLFGKKSPITVGTEGKEVTFYAHKDVAQTPCHCDIFKSLVHCVSGSCLQRYKKLKTGNKKGNFIVQKIQKTAIVLPN